MNSRMTWPLAACFVLLVARAAAPAATSEAAARAASSRTKAPSRARSAFPSELAGTWAGTVSHGGETQPIALGLEPDTSGRVMLRWSVPVIHLDHLPIGRVTPRIDGDSIRLGPFRLRHDRAARTLNGAIPSALVPVYALEFSLHKVDRFDPPPRPEPDAPMVQPAWTFEAHSPLWAGPTFADGVVYVGAEDGRLYALDALSGAMKWSFRAEGPIRTRPTAAGDGVYFQADDGYLYGLSIASGALRWRVKIVEGKIERLPFDDPKSRFDRFGSDVAAVGSRLYVGTHEGTVLALDAEDGSRVWEFAAGDAVLAAPAVVGDRVVFGSYDHFVYALDASTGRLLWKRDTRGAVVSTPAVDGDRVVIGNRCYDLLGLDLASGAVAWKRYVWMSWVESSATIRDGVAYVGSSDAAALFAVDARTGKRVWTTDVFGWAWGQPAVTNERVYVGTSSQVGYFAQHVGGAFALDRRTGTIRWRFRSAAPDSGAYGYPGSPAIGAGRVFMGGLDGRVCAFAE